MTRDELREKVMAHFEACGPDSDAAADGAIAIVGEACAEIVSASDFQWTAVDSIRALTSEKPADE